ncbi:hypothetical protein AC482_00630 [miscellaneous Crenarchaeota group-15 archaeon DG-45]|uniref:Undecaprenyl-diphosphatase n=1 Tax=miscellaneous Crenarchaeota group-15 archaeon DG-45 TaxID=1685127 RepID=A0A0M0BSB8_9ARCH|nr:MAG: hypothetical protein AC482_00630 [miscellaneous Crenarchaeota group-15 archaeon DG-45]
MSPLVAALIVGLLQGIIEWLPISSQGNLILIMVLFLGLDAADALVFSVFIHMGTGLAALTYFRGDIKRALQVGLGSGRRLFRFLAVATLVTGAVGLPLFLSVRVASVYGEALLALTGAALISMGVVERRARRWGRRTAETLSLGDGVLLGLVQGLSAIPGVSRSGVTASALLLKGFSGEEALRISFLMSIPAVFAAALGLTLIEGPPPLEPSFMVALATSYLSAFLSVDLLLRLTRRVRFWALCIALGAAALLPLIPHLL